MKLSCYADADFAGCRITRRSRNGIIILLGNSYLMAKSKKQSCNTDSSTYAETKCIVDASKFIVRFRDMLQDLGFPQKEPTMVHQDNQQTISIIRQSGSQNRSRGFDIQYRYAQDLFNRGTLSVTYTKSADMLADVLNKAVSAELIQRFNNHIGLNVFPGRGEERRDMDTAQVSLKTTSAPCNMAPKDMNEDAENMQHRKKGKRRGLEDKEE